MEIYTILYYFINKTKYAVLLTFIPFGRFVFVN